MFSELLDFPHKVYPIVRAFNNILEGHHLQPIGGVAVSVASVYFGPWVAAAFSARLINI